MDSIVFESGSQDGTTMCVSLIIVNDFVPEPAESFTIHLNTEEDAPNVFFMTQWATVLIIDSNRELWHVKIIGSILFYSLACVLQNNSVFFFL